MSEAQTRRPSMVPVIIVSIILVAFVIFFVVEFLILSESSSGVAEDELTADTYMDIVTPLLASADPARGEELILQYGCTACHGGENAGRLAPDWSSLREVAADRRSPLTAAAYVYESIIHPGAYTVEGYVNNMPRLYDEQISEADLGDIIAYLISEDS